MSMTQSQPLLRQIRHLIGAGPEARLSDGQLLDRFVAAREEAAFEGLVRRYGPLVLGVCRRVLRDAHAAEDAFQATFLVLVRKAASLDRRQPLGGWLHTVAYRLALRARASEGRRRACETLATSERQESSSAASSDLAAAVEEELMRLPEKHRLPLVLCYLEGKTNEQAAQALGCPKGSISWRLAQARDTLRDRLTRRGWSCPATLLSSLLAPAAIEAAVLPVPLVRRTVQSALWFIAEEAAPIGAASAQVLALAQGALTTMTSLKWKVAAGFLLCVGLLGGGLASRSSADAQTTPAPAAAPSATRPAVAPSLPEGVSARLGSSHLRHGDAIFHAAYLPDGKSIVTAGKDQTVRLWDQATGREIRRFDRGPMEPPPVIKMGQPNVLRMSRMGNVDQGFPIALSKDGRTLASSNGERVLLWDVATGKRLREFKTGHPTISTVQFANDGKTLATLGAEGVIHIWDLETGKSLRRHGEAPAPAGKGAPNPLAPPTRAGLAAALSPDLNYLAAQEIDLASQSFNLKIIDMRTGKEVAEISAPVGGAQALVFSPDGKTLALGAAPGGVQLCDVMTGKEIKTFEGARHEGSIDSLAFSADGKRIAVGRDSGVLDLWDVASGEKQRTIGTPPPRAGRMVMVRVVGLGVVAGPALTFSPDGQTVAASHGGTTLRQYEVATGKETLPPGVGHRSAVATLATDGQRLLTHGRGDSVHIWDLKNGRSVGEHRLPDGAGLVAISADGKTMAVATPQAVKVIDAATGKETISIPVGASGVSAVGLSANGRRVATRESGTPDIRIWDAATGKELRAISPATEAAQGAGAVVMQALGLTMPDLVFSPDGRHLAGAGGKRQLCLWDAETGDQLWEAAFPQDQTADRVAFAPSGRALAVRHANGTVSLYETATGERRTVLGKPSQDGGTPHFTVSFGGMSMPLHDKGIPAAGLAYSPDGRVLAVAEAAKSGVRLWDTTTGQELAHLKGHEGGVVSLLFTPDGKQMISGSRDTTALVWDVASRRAVVSVGGERLDDATLDTLWKDLGGRDSEKAYLALRRLAGQSQQAADLVASRLAPVTTADARKIERLIADLESDEFEVRRKAETELEQLADFAEPILRKTLKGEPSLDVRQRVERLLRKISGVALDGPRLRELRTIELLEAVQAEVARPVLEKLAKGAAEARLTREAKAALGRMSGNAK